MQRRALEDFGYYLYRGRIYFDKYKAFEDALERGDLKPTISFHFQLADRIDWTVEPEATLAELYQQRARELRERYDYLILLYSGGADSTQVLRTFLNVGAFLDEVCTFVPMGMADKLATNSDPQDPMGLLNEYQLAAVPGLRELSFKSPLTRVRVVDTTHAYLGDMSLWQQCFSAQRPSGGTHGLFHSIRATSIAVEMQRRADDLNRRVGVIYGAEKPFMRLIGNELYVFFSDVGRVGVQCLWHYGDQALFDPVMFFWGEPRIVCKQAHVIKRRLTGMIRYQPGSVYVDGSTPGLDPRVIYPDWDGRYQQLRKGEDGAILPMFLGARSWSIAADRDRYYNNRYGRLSLIQRMTGQEPRVRLSELQTRLYSVGKLCSSSGG